MANFYNTVHRNAHIAKEQGCNNTGAFQPAMHRPPTIRSLTGMTRSGEPLALSRAPSEDIKPWFHWMAVAEARIPEGQTIECKMLNDQACLRLLWGGTWTAETADGHQVFHPGEEGVTLYFGPHSKAMPISVTGSYRVVTLTLQAGAPAVLGGPPVSEMVDRILIHDEMVGHGKLTSKIPVDDHHDNWFVAAEDQLRRFLDTTEWKRPDPMVVAFENACLTDPDFSISDFASRHGTTTRTLERMARRNFGLTPKQVMRRARALDMAATLLGVAMPDEEPEMRLRYFDQSHLTREMHRFFGMTPGEIARGPHPFLTLSLEIRQSRRLRVLDELGADEEKPWLERRQTVRD